MPLAATSATAVHPNRLIPGDLLPARIMRILSDGRPHLQIGASEFVAQQPLRGQVGDVLWFEVQSHGLSGENGGRIKMHLVLRLVQDKIMAGALAGKSTTGSMPRPPLGPGELPATSTVLRGTTTAPQPSVMHSALSTLPFAGPLASLGRQWFQKRRHRLGEFAQQLKAADRASHPRPASEHHHNVNSAAVRMTSTDFRETEPGFSYGAVFRMAANGAPHRTAQVYLRAGASRSTMDASCRILTASLMLNLEKTGEVTVEVQMHEDQMQVALKVETEPVRLLVQDGLRDLYSALQPLARAVCCQVRIDPSPPAQCPMGKPRQKGIKEIDLTI